MALPSLVASVSARSFPSAGIDTTGAKLLVLLVSFFSGNPTPIVDSYGNTWHAIATANSSTNFTGLYYAWNPTVGTGHTFTVDPSAVFPTICVMAFDGVQTASDPLDQQASNSGNANASLQPGSVTPSVNGELLISGIGLGSSSGWAIDSGFTIQETNAFAGGAAFATLFAYFAQAVAGALNPQWTWTPSVYNAGVNATFKPAPSGGGAKSQQALVLG